VTPLRIALVHPYRWPEVRRGAERYLEDLALYLSGAGHQVDVVTGTSGRSSWSTVHGTGKWVRRHVWAVPGSTRLGLGEVEVFGLAAVRPLVASRYDVVHGLTPTAALAGWVARRPTLYTVLGHPHRHQIPRAGAQRLAFTSAVRRSAMVAVLSEASAKALHDELGRRAEVLPPGIRLEQFAPDLAPRLGPPRVLFSASLSDRRKRADLAVAAFGRLLEHHPEARLSLSGEGDVAWALPERSVGAERLRAAIDLPGVGDPGQQPERYRQATVTLLPSEHEAFGLALVESLACGTPVVCTPSGGMPEIAGAPGVGVVAESAEPAALADALRRAVDLARDPATPGRCVAQARRWSWDEVGPRHEALYRRLARRSC